MSAKAPAKGHTAKHTAAKKHATSSGKSGTKHTPAKHKQAATEKSKGHAQVHTKATHAKEAKPAGFAIGDLLPVCAFEAVAMSARLLGARIHDDDVGELWHLLGEPADGVPVGDALAAAVRFGLAGYRPGGVLRLVPAVKAQATEAEIAGVGVEQYGRSGLGLAERWRRLGDAAGIEAFVEPREGLIDVDVNVFGGVVNPAHGLILRIDVPGPHAVLATADGWWSWGELYSPWPCRVSEAWAVSWS